MPFPTMCPHMSRAVFNKHVQTDAQEIEHLRNEMVKQQQKAEQLERENQKMAEELESAMAELEDLRVQLPHKKHKARQ